jgi:hypothetical protein
VGDPGAIDHHPADTPAAATSCVTNEDSNDEPALSVTYSTNPQKPAETVNKMLSYRIARILLHNIHLI